MRCPAREAPCIYLKEQKEWILFCLHRNECSICYPQTSRRCLKNFYSVDVLWWPRAAIEKKYCHRKKSLNADKRLKKLFILLENEINKICFPFFSLFLNKFYIKINFFIYIFLLFSTWPRTAISRELPYLR